MGKASKKRQCPAAGRPITPAECGQGRHSRFTCPPDCAFNPFAPANYSQLLQIEQELDTRSLDWLLTETPNRAALERELQQARSAKSGHALHVRISWRFLFETDEEGRTSAQRLELGEADLRNDQRVLLRAKQQTCVALVEVRRVLDEEQTEMVDLLSARPVPFVVRDRGLASMAGRFSVFLGWLYPLPHFHRLSGTAILLPDLQVLEPKEIVTEIVRHLGGPADEVKLRRWLAEHFVRFEDALSAVSVERRRLMFEGMDVQFGKAVYELRRPFAECRDVLDSVPEVAEDNLADGERTEGFAEARVWFGGPEDVDLLGGALGRNAVLGRVLLGQSHWRLEAMGAAKLAALRERCERTLGDRVRFTGERFDNLAASMIAKHPKVDVSLVPPRLLENPQHIRLVSSRVDKPIQPIPPKEHTAQLVREQEGAWLDESIEALGGLTPRAAARDPKWRSELIRLMKSRVRACDERNLREGTNEDINWMLRELGLTEILFEPPPPNRQPRQLPDDLIDHDLEDEEDADVDAFEGYQAASWAARHLPPAPPLPPGPFSEADVAEAVGRVMEEFGTGKRTIEQAEAEGCPLIGVVDRVTAKLLDDRAFTLLVPFLVMAWEIFVPRGTRGPDLNPITLMKRIHDEIQSVARLLETRSEAAFERQFSSGSQPALMSLLVGMILESLDQLPKRERPETHMEVIMLGVLRAVIEELDAARRSDE